MPWVCSEHCFAHGITPRNGEHCLTRRPALIWGSLQWQCCVPPGGDTCAAQPTGTTGCHHHSVPTDRASHLKHHLNKNLISHGKAPPLHGDTHRAVLAVPEPSAGASSSSRKLFWVSRLEKPQITPPPPAPERVTSLSPEPLTQLAQRHVVGPEPILGCSQVAAPKGAALQGGVGTRLLYGGTRSPIVVQHRDAQQGMAPSSIGGDAPFRKPL